MRYGFHGGSWLCGPGAFFPGPLGWVITLLFWALIIYLVFWIFKTVFAGKSGHDPRPLDTLKQRYARGEITEDEFKRMKSELS
ncbi:MAG TPA: SHOCT domain-containing protein [Desulfobulbus sp.]|nr:SHOCT domain-containing protein [Desulfobulbus sp.]